MTSSKVIYLLTVFVPGGFIIAGLVLARQFIRRRVQQNPHLTAKPRLPFAGI